MLPPHSSPQPPPYPPPLDPYVGPSESRRQPVSALDVAVSTIALLLTVVFGAVAAQVGLYLLVVLDACPNQTCNVSRAASVVGIDLAVVFVVGVAGLVLTIVKLVRRRRAWPYAVGTLGLCVVFSLVGGVGYFAAAGA